VVEVGGVEPPSENLSAKASTCVADVLDLAAQRPRRRGSRQPARWFSSCRSRAGTSRLSLPVWRPDLTRQARWGGRRC